MKSFPRLFGAAALCIASVCVSTTAIAADLEVRIAIKDHKFDPAEIRVPAQQRIKPHIHNQDPSPEEFESHSIKREKVMSGGAKAVLTVGPLKPGRYPFFGEFNPTATTGVLIAE
jgi:hypothetical protein